MDASTEAGASSAPVVFKRKRGPAARPAPFPSASAASLPSSSTAGPSRASHSLSNSTTNRLGSDSDEEVASSAVVIKKRRANHNPLVQSTAAVLRRTKLGGDSDEDPDDDVDSLTNDTLSRGSSRPRGRLGEAGASSTSTAAASLQRIRDDATRHSDWDLTAPSSSLKETPKTSNDDGLYRGAGAYTSYVAARDDGTSSKMRSRGPIRQTTTVRTTSLMDYQPDVCKDYKETGYCGFGDTCKFLHDRSDYLAGWQLDVLPNSTGRTRETLLSDPEASDDDKDEVPFACLICRQPFTEPVVTRCGHYFCAACALKRYAKNSKCFACGKQTGGLFNSARKILDKMEHAKQRKAAARAERDSWKNQADAQPVTELGADADDDDDDGDA